MSITDVSRPRGRPKSAGKRAAIVEAARLLFVGNAYESVTMDQIASAAGVAKMTVYGHFQDKGAVFEAVVRSVSDVMAAALPGLPGGSGTLEQELVTFGEVYLHVLLTPGLFNSFHKHMDVVSRTPALAARIYEAGPGHTLTVLAAYLRSATDIAHFTPERAAEAASDLMSLWLGDKPLQLALGLSAPALPDEITRHVRRCTRLFLRAYDLSPK